MSDAPKKPEEKPAIPAEAAVPGAKLKPPPFTQEQLAEQILTMRNQKNQLTVSVTQLNQQLHKIQTALKENDLFRTKIATQIAESNSNFTEEFKRKSDFFPEIRLQMILKATEAFAPKKK